MVSFKCAIEFDMDTCRCRWFHPIVSFKKDLDRTDPSESEPRFYVGSIVLTHGHRMWGFRIGDISGEKGLRHKKHRWYEGP